MSKRYISRYAAKRYIEESKKGADPSLEELIREQREDIKSRITPEILSGSKYNLSDVPGNTTLEKTIYILKRLNATNPQVARCLRISESTVKRVYKRIFKRMET